jgi:hypothetical protein
MHPEIYYLQFIIPTLYGIIALQFLFEAGKATNIPRRIGSLSMVAIFVLCAFSGYVSYALGMSDEIRVWSHYILAAAAFVYIATNQAGKVMKD